MHGVQDDPAYRTLRGAVNARTTLDAGFTTVRNLGLMVKTGGYYSTLRCSAPSIRAGMLARASTLRDTPSPLRRASGPDRVPATRARDHAALGR